MEIAGNDRRNEQGAQNPIRRVHNVGNSMLVAIAPPLVKKLNIDEGTFFEEKETAEGILLVPRRLA